MQQESINKSNKDNYLKNTIINDLKVNSETTNILVLPSIFT